MPSLTLYDFPRSSASYRLRIGLSLKGLPFEERPVNILPGKDEQFAAPLRALNPQARVPFIASEQGVLNQSLAILEWLDETFPAPAFYPEDPWEKAQIRAFAFAIACDIHPLNNLAVLAQLEQRFAADQTAIASWYRHWIEIGFAALEARLAACPATPFCFGEAPTMADICLVPQMANARRYQTDLSPFPRLVAIDERARAHPRFAAALPPP